MCSAPHSTAIEQEEISKLLQRIELSAGVCLERMRFTLRRRRRKRTWRVAASHDYTRVVL